MKLLIRIATVIIIIIIILLSSITLALIVFPFLYAPMGIQNAFLACISFGLLIGTLWARWVLKNKQEDDYRFYHLYKTDDIVETWVKERNREKMKEKDVASKSWEKTIDLL